MQVTDWRRARFVAAEHRVEEHLGKSTLFLRDGLALFDAGVTDGEIECEMALPRARTFSGVVWRAQDEHNYEHFYLRAHQNGNPDATQYTPVFNGISAWQLYHGSPFQEAITFPLEEWVTVRARFSGDRAQFMVGDHTLPAVPLKRPFARGSIGVHSGASGAHFANLRLLPSGAVAAPPAPSAAAPGLITCWSVSRAREATADASAFNGWMPLAAEPSGRTNLASLQGPDAGATAAARVVVRSPRAQTKRIDFGFTNKVRVFLNGAPLFAGDDAYASRDYRFLGSMGWWDSLYLQLREGHNELLFACTAGGGGWGVQARFADPSDITFGDDATST